MDVVINYELYDITMDLDNGNFLIAENTLKNEIVLAIQTDSYDSDYNLGLRDGGFINEEIGNNLWLLTYQSAWTPQIRSLIKEEIRNSLLDYGSIEYSLLNRSLTIVELRLFDGTIIKESFII